MNTERSKKLVNSFVDSAKESIYFYSDGRLSEGEIDYLAEYVVNRLDFNNEWQMHKGIGYFARQVVDEFLLKQSTQIGDSQKTVTYTTQKGQKPTPEQLKEIEEAKKKPIEYDEDCEKLSPEMIKAFECVARQRRNNRLPLVSAEQSEEFLQEANENKMSKEAKKERGEATMCEAFKIMIKNETIRNMLERGKSVEDIMDFTGYSKEEIEEAKADIVPSEGLNM